MRNHAGDLIRKTHAENAEALVSRGLGEWIGRGDKRYVRLSESAPTLQTAQGWRGGSNTTQRIRTDAGIIVGAPKSGLEHKPLH
ncbi:MAG: hypothetical protein ACRD45_21855 [Bryobacteraceae bacterium]